MTRPEDCTSDEIKIRRWRKKDIPALLACHRAVYGDYNESSLYEERHFRLQQAAFPEGQFLAEIDGNVIGYASSIIVQLDADNEFEYSYSEITGGGTYSTHDPLGDSLYGTDIGVHPDFRGRRVASLFYQKRKALLQRYNLRRMIAFGRIPGYAEVGGKLTPDEYVQAVRRGDIKDLALNAHLRAGYTVKQVLLNFFPDPSSLNYSTFLECLNPKFDPAKRRIAVPVVTRPATRLRVCAAQYQMRRIASWDEFRQIVEFFVETADAYHSHFLVLPEYFTAQMVYTMGEDIDFPEVAKILSTKAAQYREMMVELAIAHQLYIVGGSHPVERDGALYNVAHLFSPTGKIYTQDKLHVTPIERRDWGVRPGEGLNIFATPFGKVAILVCYDIEFPELSRLLANAGVEVLFVPFSTDEAKAYNRVRLCARARAVENYFYVVISGNVGNLPTIKNYLLNYGQSAVFTPCDFAFPSEGIAGQADPNVETVVITDLDLNALRQQRAFGSVRPYFDRRPDIYELSAKVPLKVTNVE